MNAFEAMQFARDRHAGQTRKYTGAPYVEHLAEVAGIVAGAIRWNEVRDGSGPAQVLAVCWLHDVREDCGVTYLDLQRRFGRVVADGVTWLSDLETEGNRAERKAASRARLALAPNWVQSIKVADMISNTASIVLHDPKFAVTYLEEKRLLLDVLTLADPRLVEIARGQVA